MKIIEYVGKSTVTNKIHDTILVRITFLVTSLYFEINADITRICRNLSMFI